MSDLPSQYAEEMETFRQILDLPDLRETLPRSSTTVLALDDLLKSVFPLSPLGPLWARCPYKFLRNLNIKLGRIYLPSISQLLSLGLPLPVTLL